MDAKRGEREFADFDNAINQANSLGFKVAYSNDAFELWFYLHFQYTDQQHHRTFYYRELGKIWGLNYEKKGKNYKFCSSIYNRLMNGENASQELAIQSAEKLFKGQSDLSYSRQNPVAKVYELVRVLNENLRK